MKPLLRKNVYPRSEENVRAVFLYFFPKAKNSDVDEATAEFYDKRENELNYLEFYAETTAENSSFFESEFKNVASISLMMNYTINALTKTENDWKGSSTAIMITKRLRAILELK